jgi:hypothetical protein
VVKHPTINRIPIINVSEKMKKPFIVEDRFSLVGGQHSPTEYKVMSVTPDDCSFQSPHCVSPIISDCGGTLRTFRNQDRPVGINDASDTVTVIDNFAVHIESVLISRNPDPQIWPLIQHQGALRNVSLPTDAPELEESNDGIDTRDVNDCPTRRWWPLGIVLSACGFALTAYGAKRFYDRDLERRIYHLWWLPLTYFLIILGSRVAAYGICRDALPF